MLSAVCKLSSYVNLLLITGFKIIGIGLSIVFSNEVNIGPSLSGDMF